MLKIITIVVVFISFNAYSNAKREDGFGGTFSVDPNTTCQSCKGKLKKCMICNGRGQTMKSKCNKCNGRGKQHVTCLKCNSTGKKKQKENIIKNIPSEHEIKLSEPSLAYATCPKNIISTNDVFLLYNVPPFDYKVFQVIDDNIILVEMPYISESKTIIAMVKLQSNHNYVDGEEIHEEHKLKYIGNRRYTTAVGSIKTVRYFEEMKLSKNNIKEN